MEHIKKIGIMGGTFNPIHIGHIQIARSAYDLLKLNGILFIPSGISYMKENVLDKEKRVAMTRIAIEQIPYFELSTIETEKLGNSYSFETIAELKLQNPDTEYYFLVGADSLFYMEKWYQPEKIFKESMVCVYYRKGFETEDLLKKIEYLKEKYQCDIKLLSLEPVDVSSSEIREKVKNGESIKNLVPEEVEEYIYNNKLYTD